jgi:DNA-binding cell septation regulator SpoVG
VKNIVKNIREKNNNTSYEAKNEILDFLNVTLKQNYVQHNGHLYKQDNGLAMGAPSSAIVTEIFMQYLEHTITVDILKKYQIIDYYRYVDDILIIYSAQTTNINNTLISLI